MPFWLIHVGYGLMFLALAVRDVLKLRIVISNAQLILLIYALYYKNYPVAFWNLIFVLINIYYVIVLLKERKPISLSEEMQYIYEKSFLIMTRREFIFFWRKGKKRTLENTLIIKKKERSEEVSLILEGEASVVHNKKEIAVLKKGSFVGEMSFLSNGPASADVSSKGILNCISWNRKTLDTLQRRHPAIWNKVLSVIGRDLVEKIKNTSSRLNKN